MRRLAIPSTAALALCCLALAAPSASAAPPTILATSFSAVGTESVRLEAEINPQGKATQYHFEYGPADCAANPCTQVPFPEEGKLPLPAGSSAEPVSAEVAGLSPGTSYHFRVVAKSGGGKAEGPDTTFATYRPPPAFAPCPSNEAFRTGELSPPDHPSAKLPDCRAYEQASPRDKNGADARGTVAFAKASVNGDRIGFVGSSGIPGAEGSQEVPTYLASRTEGNWTTQGMLPPETAGSEAFVLGWTPDFSEVFDMANRFSKVGGATFLARSSEGGSLTEIVPYGAGLTGANLFYAGSAADGAEVLFESPAKLSAVPAALEGKSNLYLWDRETDAVSLAGVFNDGTAPPAGAFAGSYDWINPQPTALDSGGAADAYYTQDQHAISSDGSVYFTAAKTGQLYLRRNPTEPQSAMSGEECTEPAMACTLQVSASEKTNGTGPGGADAAGERPAAFMEASPDGSKALFTSSEKLTDDANTGPELLPAAIARAKLSDSSEKSLSFLPAHARGIAVDATHIYWADPEDGTIGRAELGGGHPEPEFIDKAEIEAETEVKPGVFEGIAKPQYVAVDGEHIYWSNAADGQVGTGTIGRAKLGSTEAEEVKPEFITGATDPQGVAVNSEYVYWANAGLPGGGGFGVANRTISRAKLGSGGAEEVEQTFIQVDEGAQEFRPQGLAVDASHIYAGINGSQVDSYVFRFDIDGEAASRKILFNGHETEVKGVALDASHVYWADPEDGTIGRAKLDFSEPELEFIKEADEPLGLAVDGERVYWSANQGTPPNPGNDLYRWDAATGKLTDLAPDPTGDGAEVKGVLGTSDDGSYVYFAANGDLDGAGPAEAGDCKAEGENHFLFSSGQCSLYLAHEGTISFIARLDAEGGVQPVDAADWLPHGGVGGDGQLQKTARVTPDGRTLLFSSQSRLTAYDNKGLPELYRYRVGEGIGCVSCDPTGAPPTGAPSLGSVSLSTVFPTEWSYTLSRNLSADGNRVFFETTDALVGEDANGAAGCPLVGPFNGKYRSCLDVYEWEAKGTGSCEEDVQGGGCLYLLSSGKSADASYLADASASGKDVFILTRSRFVGQDEDQLLDVYDAREGGGLAAQNPVAQPVCEGEGCKPAPGTAPGAESPGSASFQGPADPKPKSTRHRRRKHHRKRNGRAAKNDRNDEILPGKKGHRAKGHPHRHR